MPLHPRLATEHDYLLKKKKERKKERERERKKKEKRGLTMLSRRVSSS